MGGLLVDEFELRYADYSLGSDQEAVRDAFAEFFRNECPSERVRAAEPLGYDEKLWRQLADGRRQRLAEGPSAEALYRRDPVRVHILDLLTRRSGMPTVTLGTTRLVVKAV